MRILLVDDDDIYLTLIGDLLREQGYQVVEATDGKQAREVLDAQSVDLIISDIFMPTLDGPMFYSYVREFSGQPAVPFIFMSGLDDERTRQTVVDPDLDSFVSKAAPVGELLARIGRYRKGRETVDA